MWPPLALITCCSLFGKAYQIGHIEDISNFSKSFCTHGNGLMDLYDSGLVLSLPGFSIVLTNLYLPILKKIFKLQRCIEKHKKIVSTADILL